MDGLKARLSFDAVAYDYDDEYLTIDTDTHTININNVSRLFGVQYDGNSKLIKFRIRNKLSDIQKMQDSIIYINWIDSRGVKGQSIAINKTINNDTCEFAWKVPFDALKNSGVLHFAMSAVITENNSSVINQKWSTQIASVTTPDGIYIKSYTPSSEEEDRIAQIYNELSKMINKQSDNLNSLQAQVSSLKEDLDNKIFSKNNTINILPPDFEYGIYNTDNGTKQDDDSHIRTPYAIKLPDELVGNRIRWFSTVNVTDYITFLFYRNENTNSFISADSTNSDTANSIPVPTGAKYLRVSAYKEYDFKNLCITQQFTNRFVPYKESSYSNNESHLLLNKNIVNFGDSIFGAVPPPKDVSSFLQQITGANVINVGFGGCRMGYHDNSIYDPFSMYRLADSIYSNDWTLQDNAIASGSLPGDFDTKVQILKQINWSTIDIITISYGTNDFADGLQPWQTPEEQAQNPEGFNRYVSDTLRYSIEKILSKYPNIRIFILTPCYRFRLNSDGDFLDDSNTWKVKSWTGDYSTHTLIDFVEAEKKVAKEYQLPVIDNYFDLGINKYNRTEYFPSNDGTHHNEKGRELIAKHIDKYLW